MSGARLKVVEAGELPEYPLDPDLRLTTHYFMAFHHDRWLASRFRAIATPAVRGYAVDLWCLAQKQTPVGTLPDDDRELAFLLHLDPVSWRVLRETEPSPLYGWRRVRCGASVRLAHPVVTEILLDALSQRERKAAQAEADRRAKRLLRLRDLARRAGATERMLQADPELLDRLDDWLSAHFPPPMRRTEALALRALEADALRKPMTLNGN